MLLLMAALSLNVLSAQNINSNKTGNDRFSIRAQAMMGKYLAPSGNIEELDPNAPTGLTLGIEFPSSRQRPWQQYLNDPTVGLGLTTLNFGNDAMGEGIALYPYIMIPAVSAEHLRLSLKVAGGLTAVNGHYKATVNQVIPNRTFGSMINTYLSAGLNLDIPIVRNLAINGEFGFYHISNGRTVEPNKGVNVLYGGVGLIATLNPDEGEEKAPVHFPDLPYKWSLNITAAAGAQNADMEDDRKFMISTFHVGGVYSATNWYGIGLGADVFYNDAVSNETKRGLFCPEHEYSTIDKVRVGLSLNNEFKFGDVTAMADWGIYLFNPSRHYYNFDHERKGHDSRLPLFYKSDGPGSQEHWHYIRFGLKYRIWDNMYLQALAKTHLHICEYIEFGIGYQIPFLRKGQHKGGGSSVFHHSRNWWKEY